MVSETKTTEAPTLRRELKARHLTMIAIGGSIGTGLFVASGATISQAGPGGALLSYILIGLMVYFLMTSLGELAAFMPVSGSFATYGQNYVEEGFGFALGWNYWYNWAVTIAVDLVASQLVMSYWFPDTPGWIWSALFLGIMFLLNWISVRGFGEAEYWFSLIKVATVIIFIIVGVMMIVGIFKGAQPAGWSNWGIADAPFAGGFSAMIGVAMIVGFSFQGTELIGIAAGESENPEKNIPRAVRQVFWRILLFYVFAILIISLIIPYTDPSLLRNDVKDISVSPFTLVFQHAGLLSAAAIMNAVILTAVLSAGNSGMYASTRMLYTLACDGKAPRIFSKLSRGGVPRNALYATTVIAALCFLTSMFGNQTVYLWLLNTSGMTGFIAWLGKEGGALMSGISPGMATIVLLLAFYLLHYLFASTTAHTTALLPAMLTIASTIPGMNMEVFVLLMVTSLGVMGIITPYGTGPSPIYYGSGYLPTKDYWRLGTIFGAIFLAALLLIGYPWMSMMF
ncbi:amino acid permease [Klebsiella pneumoniae]|nr:amino acid permease [Klebsiella pneumoniae]MBM0442006.1 amino acid permease [Klebsiella pneumoniae]